LGTIIPSLPVGLTEEEGSICSVAAGFFCIDAYLRQRTAKKKKATHPESMFFHFISF
jgi:hypothetical protein